MQYARRDVRHLLYIADCLGQELLAPPQHKAKHEEEQQLAAEAAATEAPDLAAAAEAAAGVAPASPRAAAGGRALADLSAAAGPSGSSAEGASSSAVEQQAEQVQPSRQPRGGEVVELAEPPAGPPPSIVQPTPEAEQALVAAMAVPLSQLERTVFRSQALTLTLHQPTPPAAAVAAAATGLVRRHVAAVLERHARLTPAQVHHLEAVADCVHVLASWRDAAARQADEGLQCLLPDAELLRLAEAAAGSVAPEASNLRGKAQRISERQLLELLPPIVAQGPAAPAGEVSAAAGQGQAGQGQAGAAGMAASAEEAANGSHLAEAASSGAAAAGGDAANGAADTPGSCGCWPAMLQRDAVKVAATLSEAAAGQRPWVSQEVQELLREAAGGGTSALGKQNGGSGSNKMARRRDPVAFRQRQAAKFAAKGTVGGGQGGAGAFEWGACCRKTAAPLGNPLACCPLPQALCNASDTGVPTRAGVRKLPDVVQGWRAAVPHG